MKGITGFGAYIPKARLQRQSMVEANGWFDAGLNSLGQGERSMCNWDEDTITMAVEAGKDCLTSLNNANIDTLYLASTTLPFLDRQNSVIVREAINLNPFIKTMDISASQRAATSALLALLDGTNDNCSLLIASEHRRTKAGSRAEMLWGDGAASVVVGTSDVIAEYLGGLSIAVDFIDHYRGEDSDFDYDWEERWVRDEGFMKIVPEMVNRLLERCELQAADVRYFVFPTDQSRTPLAVAKKIGINPDALLEGVIPTRGVAGVAEPILQLCAALEQAKAGEIIVVAGFGQGCDVLAFKATEKISSVSPACGYRGALKRRLSETNYNKFLSFNDLLQRDIGKRGEADKQTYLSGFNRRRDLLNGFIGGKCRECGTLQIPRENYCVNPDCQKLDSQDDHPFSNATGTVMSWTADELTFDWNPPAYFGMVQFEGGGKLMMDFTEVEKGAMDSGAKVSVHFRIKGFDTQRGFVKYFWKAVLER